MIYSYKGTKIVASSRKEAISKIVASNFITVDYIDQYNYKDYIGKKVNVKRDVYLAGFDLKELPIIFGTVGGLFDCSYNYLTSLRGCPSRVGKNFHCHHNKLTSLKGCPSKVNGNFDCSYNKKKFTKEDVEKVCKVDRDIFV